MRAAVGWLRLSLHLEESKSWAQSSTTAETYASMAGAAELMHSQQLMAWVGVLVFWRLRLFSAWLLPIQTVKSGGGDSCDV